jgi:hypothetical protein
LTYDDEVDAAVPFAAGSLAETKSRLIVDCAEDVDAGRYTCVAQNAAGKTSVESEVSVVGE